MKQIITLEILIENREDINFSVTYEIKESIHDKYSWCFRYNDIQDLVKKSLKKIGHFTTLTATISVKTDDDCIPYGRTHILESFRYINTYSGLKFCKLVDDMYPDFTPSEKKTIYPNIKRLVETANTKFIEILRDNAKQTAA